MEFSSNGYFFFFLAVFFALAFFAFLAMLPSVIPKFAASRPSTCRVSEYTTITNLIPRVSKKVNDGRAVAACDRTKPSRDALRKRALLDQDDRKFLSDRKKPTAVKPGHPLSRSTAGTDQ